MIRVTTQFDVFVDALTAWMNDLWFMWIALGLIVVMLIVIIPTARRRARARDRIPRYRRRDS